MVSLEAIDIRNPDEETLDEQIIAAYITGRPILFDNAIDERIPRVIRKLIPAYVETCSEGFKHPIDEKVVSDRFYVRSLDITQARRSKQKVRRWQVCWTEYRKDKEKTEELVREALPYLAMPLFYTLKVLHKYHKIPKPNQQQVSFECYHYKNNSERRRMWTLPWHTDSVALVGMYGSREGVIVAKSHTGEKYEIDLNPDQTLVVIGEKWTQYLKNHGIETEEKAIPHKVKIPAKYKERNSFNCGLQVE
jgi:hypothetical protein